MKPGGRELRAIVDASKYPEFPSSIGHNTNGSLLNTIRITIIDDDGI